MLDMLDKSCWIEKIVYFSDQGDVPTRDDSSHVCWKDWEGNSGQKQWGSRRILLMTRHRKFNYRRVKTVVFVSKQIFVSWFFQTLLPAFLGDSKGFPILCAFKLFPTHPLGTAHLAHWKSDFSSNFSFFSSFPLEEKKRPPLFPGGQTIPRLRLSSSTSPWTPSSSSTFPWSSPWPRCSFPF